jgi:DNA primase small subunit
MALGRDDMQDPTQSFIMKQFRRYYKEEAVEVPDRLSRREFGFMFFDRTFVLRHLGFRTKAELKDYLVENVPSHAYHSSAYYEKPNAQTMAEKSWMGADLVFDLDADHLKNAAELSYPEMLAAVKREIIRLIDDYIAGDLGFVAEKLKIVFSGGRGYHVHVLDPRVQGLGSHERREIVDYIIGTDLNFDWVFPTRSFDSRQFAQRTTTIQKREMPDDDSGGWKRRMVKGIDRFLVDLEVIGEDEAVKRYSTIKDESGRAIGDKTIRGMYRELFEKERGKRGVDRMRGERNFEIFSRQTYLNAFVRLVEDPLKVSLVGETDEPVTSDIKRLIRLPSSLHGKTGLRVTEIDRGELEDFDPLRDAVPNILTDKAVKVVAKEDVDIALRGERISLPKGEGEVPEFAALFLACRKTVEMAK